MKLSQTKSRPSPGAARLPLPQAGEGLGSRLRGHDKLLFCQVRAQRRYRFQPPSFPRKREPSDFGPSSGHALPTYDAPSPTTKVTSPKPSSPNSDRKTTRLNSN